MSVHKNRYQTKAYLVPDPFLLLKDSNYIIIIPFHLVMLLASQKHHVSSKVLHIHQHFLPACLVVTEPVN